MSRQVGSHCRQRCGIDKDAAAAAPDIMGGDLALGDFTLDRAATQLRAFGCTTPRL
jgi:hypothetical protein